MKKYTIRYEFGMACETWEKETRLSLHAVISYFEMNVYPLDAIVSINIEEVL